jgi:cytidine deaminase
MTRSNGSASRRKVRSKRPGVRAIAAELVRAAHDVAQRAHSPYSSIRVGAALMCADGSVVAGCNVESASYGLTQCAERAALTAAIALGQRRFVRLAIWASTPRPLMPCGACRQVLVEHAPELELTTSCGWDAAARCAGRTLEANLADLLPGAVQAADVLASAPRARRRPAQPGG